VPPVKTMPSVRALYLRPVQAAWVTVALLAAADQCSRQDDPAVILGDEADVGGAAMEKRERSDRMEDRTGAGHIDPGVGRHAAQEYVAGHQDTAGDEKSRASVRRFDGHAADGESCIVGRVPQVLVGAIGRHPDRAGVGAISHEREILRRQLTHEGTCQVILAGAARQKSHGDTVLAAQVEILAGIVICVDRRLPRRVCVTGAAVVAVGAVDEVGPVRAEARARGSVGHRKEGIGSGIGAEQQKREDNEQRETLPHFTEPAAIVRHGRYTG
jgi:hypothetical protein